MNFKSSIAFGMFLMGAVRFVLSDIASVGGDEQFRYTVSSALGLAIMTVALLIEHEARNKEKGE